MKIIVSNFLKNFSFACVVSFNGAVNIGYA